MSREHTFGGGLVLFALIAALVLAPGATAATHNVNVLTDGVSAGAADGICDADENAGNGEQCTLREAAKETSGDGVDDEIVLGAGTHTLDQPHVNDSPVSGDTGGDVDFYLDGETLTVSGVGPGSTVIEQTVSSRVIDIFLMDDSELDLSGFGVTGGETQGGTGEGAGIRLGGMGTSASSLDDLRITGNRVFNIAAPATEPRGGGLHIDVSGESEVLIGNSLFSDNLAEVIESDAPPNTTDDAAYGGALYHAVGGLEIRNTTFVDNEAKVFSVDAPGVGEEPLGGAIYSTDSIALEDDSFAGNRADFGGAMFVDDADIRSTTFDSNSSSGDGAAVQSTGSVDVINSTFSGNTADDGSAYRTASGSVEFLHTTFAENVSPVAKADSITASASTTLTNTLLDDDNPCSVSPFFDSGGGNISRVDDSDCAFDVDDIGVDDPLLGPLADNGGPTETHALPPDSPAVDAVDCFNLLASTDQRGIGSRTNPVFPTCDAGAFEYTDADSDETEDGIDNCPGLANADQANNDGDESGDLCDADDDNDGTPDVDDAFPFDETEQSDFDGDGTGDNADLDDDNDGTPDTEDAFPFDEDEQKDSDGDGIGDKADPTPLGDSLELTLKANKLKSKGTTKVTTTCDVDCAVVLKGKVVVKRGKGKKKLKAKPKKLKADLSGGETEKLKLEFKGKDAKTLKKIGKKKSLAKKAKVVIKGKATALGGLKDKVKLKPKLK